MKVSRPRVIWALLALVIFSPLAFIRNDVLWTLIFVPGLFLFWSIVDHFNHDRACTSIIAGHLALGCCPACGYDLSELSSADDGCRVCPECGGAWQTAEGNDSVS